MELIAGDGPSVRKKKAAGWTPAAFISMGVVGFQAVQEQGLAQLAKVAVMSSKFTTPSLLASPAPEDPGV